jgi:hypothetical protein
MPQSRGAVVLAVAFALAGAAAFMGMGASAVATATVHALDPTASPSPTPLDTITIDPAVVVPGNGGEALSVTAVSTSQLTSMTVDLYDTTTNDLALALPMSQSSTGPAPDETTWVSQTITTATLPLGTYTYTVSAADTGAGTLTGATTGTFAFQGTPSVTLNIDPALSYDNQTPTLSGTVTTLAPGATTPQPDPNQPLMLVDSVLGNVSLTTDASGNFSYTFAHPAPGEIFTVDVLPTPAVLAGASASTTFVVQRDVVQMSAALSAKTITYGGKVTVSGTVSYQPGSTFMPLAGATVSIYDRAGAPRPVQTAVTDAKGRFTATLPKEPATMHWVLQAAGPYLTPASVTLPMKVSLPTVISGFQATLNQFWQVSYRGCVALPAHVPGYVPALSGLTIQYAARPNGPWHTLGTVLKQKSVLCGNGGQTFGGTLAAKLNYAYYRAVYAGGTDTAGTGYLASASGQVLAWKYADRITSFSVSPRVVPRRGSLTVAGQLQYFSGKWRDYARQTVYIILRPKGSSTWFYIIAATTNSAGRFSATFTDPVTATWSAEYFGNSAHLATLAPTAYVTVT